MEISIVIPAYNEEKYIQECVLSLVDNGFDIKNIEILIIDGGSSDKTVSIVKLLQQKYSFIKLINNPKQKTPFALNAGIKNAAGNYILIAGAHAVYPSGYIQKLYELIQQPDIDVVGGSIETKVKNITPKTEAIKFVLTHKFGVGNSAFRVGASELIQVDTVPFGLYKKSIFDKTGGYNEKLIRNHDIELSSRIIENGYKIWLYPQLKVTYFARETFKGLAKNNFGNGLWITKTVFITGQFGSLRIRHYVPAIFVLSLLLPIVAGLLFGNIFYLPALLSGTLYLLLVGAIAVKNIKRQNPLYLFAAFVTLHFSYGLGSLAGFFSIK